MLSSATWIIVAIYGGAVAPFVASFSSSEIAIEEAVAWWNGTGQTPIDKKDFYRDESNSNRYEYSRGDIEFIITKTTQVK